MKVAEWKTMLYDMLELQKKVFQDFSMEYCFEVTVNFKLLHIMKCEPEILSHIQMHKSHLIGESFNFLGGASWSDQHTTASTM